MLVIVLISSSVRPSLKYSFSGSELMFTNGRTAIEAGPEGEFAMGLAGLSTSERYRSTGA